MAEKKYNVLIVDDSSFMRRVISGIIKSNGEIGIIDTAADGIEALNMINDDIEKYDIVLLDVNMPKMNGLQVLNHIPLFSKVGSMQTPKEMRVADGLQFGISVGKEV